MLWRRKCRAYEAYSRYIGEEVYIFYGDVYGTSRKVYGKIVAIEGNVIHLEREETGWRGCIDCDTCKIGQISTTRGWSKDSD